MNKINTTVLDKLIVGRVKPHIYAFTTGTVPNYLKVGDTYRAVDVRIAEWRRIFKDLVLQYKECSQIDEDRIFRDYAVHKFLTEDRMRKQLAPDTYPDIYYSNEFFENTSIDDVRDAIEDIKKSAVRNDNKYRFYTLAHLPIVSSYKRDKEYPPRKNQEQAIENFLAAVKKGRTNLLMYAVMRFGKTFTAMCCAEKIKAQKVVIVSAKADVREAWKEEIQSHRLFEKYCFFDKDSLSSTSISDTLSQGKYAAVFLTLQDLQGDEIKSRHKEIFENEIDLLIIDETHFGARAEEYGKVLRSIADLKGKALNSEIKGYDSDNDYETLKSLNAKIRLHLSGTPYRILMGDEFSAEDIIAACQFADIVDAQHEWDLEHCGDDTTKEWDNPYYGFPQMIRFAFTPSKSAIAKMQEMRKRGVTYAFSELFKPKSITKDAAGNYRYFKHEPEIMELFQAIDGYKEDSNILSFLNYEKIAAGKMCRHIVCVLPFRASCDALEYMIKRYKDKFNLLSNYEILNIAGVGNENAFPDTLSVTQRISACEASGKKTLTLTVNRMLTGCTVKEWDTMLYFKDTASPQEYDQAIFRLQNQYIETFVDANGDTIKFNMKPQTLLVDFDPHRMFQLQELKSLFYNVNNSERGNDELEKRISRELAISPIIFLNKNRLQEVTPSNIIDAVRQYSRDKSILDEAVDIPFDKKLLEFQALKDVISKINAIDDKKGLEINPYESGDVDLNIPDETTGKQDDKSTQDEGNDKQNENEDEEKKLAKKLAAYYTRILFFAFLTSAEIKSLLNVIETISVSPDNTRIAKNVGIDKNILQLIQEKVSPFVLTQLDCKIQNINALGRDCSITPIERAHSAMNKFMRVSESEVVMPINVADDLVGLIESSEVTPKTIFLDLASKQGEIACALYRKYATTIPEIVNNIYSIATSPLTFELTRKVYASLGMPTSHILDFYTGSLLGDNAEQNISVLKKIAPNIIIAGPPYKESDGGGRGESGTAIYHKYFEIAQDLTPRYIAMFLKANWYSGGRGEGLIEFRENILDDCRMRILHDYPDPTIYIKTPVVLRGGICTFLWDAQHTGPCRVYNHIKGTVSYVDRPLKIKGVNIFIRYNQAVKILKNILTNNSSFVGDTASARNHFKIASNAKLNDTTGDLLKVYLPKGKMGNIAKAKYPHYADFKDAINSWKVLVAKASPGDDTLPHLIISSPIVSEPGSLCTDSHLLVYIAKSKTEAENFAKYMKTKFFRFMMFLAKNNQNMTRDVFRFVPVLEMNEQYTDEILYKKFDISSEERLFIESVIKS